MSSAFDPFVSFVVKPFCTSARGTSFPSRPFVALTQAAKVSRHQDRQGILVFTLCVLGGCSSRFGIYYTPRAPSAVKASASQGEETGGIACATHSKQRGAIITVYLPRPPKWKEPFTRGVKP